MLSFEGRQGGVLVRRREGGRRCQARMRNRGLRPDARMLSHPAGGARQATQSSGSANFYCSPFVSSKSNSPDLKSTNVPEFNKFWVGGMRELAKELNEGCGRSLMLW